MGTTFEKTPDEVLDFKVDFKGVTNGRTDAVRDFLAAGETITSHTVTIASSTLTKDSSTLADSSTSVVIWLSAGIIGYTYPVVVQIETSDSRTAEHTIYIKVVKTREKVTRCSSN